MFDWALRHGASAPKLQLGRGDYGWGVFATADLAPSEEIASIPLSLVLTHQKAEDSAVGAAVRELNERLQCASSLPHPAVPISPRTTQYLFMLQQLADPAAFFHPYLASLSPPCSPLLWPATVLSHLAGTNLHAAIPNKLRQLRARYDNCVPLLCAHSPATFPSSAFTFDRFLWAHTQVTSRGFPVRVGERPEEERVTAGELRAEGSKRPNERVGCLLPLLDMTNHRMRTPITWTTTAAHDARVSFRTGEAGGGVRAGEEVFNNYGAKSNEEFLLGYGFCIADNPYDEYTVQLGGLGGDTAYLLDRLRLPWRDKGYYLTASSTPAQLLAVLRVAVMTEAEREVYGWQWAQRGAQDIATEQVGARNEVAMLDQLQQLLMSRLAKLGHSTLQQAEAAEQQDRERLGRTELTEEERLALVYRSGQRHILIERTKHTQQAKADILAHNPPLPLYRLVPCSHELDRAVVRRLTAEWNKAMSPTPIASAAVLSVPASLLITPSSIRQCASFAPVLDYAAGLSTHQELTLFVLHQLQLLAASPWDNLLNAYHHPAHAANEVLTRLVPSAEYDDASDVQQQLFPALSDVEPRLFNNDIHSLGNFLWAYYLVHRQTVMLPAADGLTRELTFLPVTPMPLADALWRGRVEWAHQRLTLSPDAAGGDVRVVHEADAEDDGRSVWTRGEYVKGAHPIIRIAASSLFPPTVVAALSPVHKSLFALFQSWEDEQAEAGHFYASAGGVSGGLLAWCRLLALSANEVAVLMQRQAEEMACASHIVAQANTGVVLDTDERVEEETREEGDEGEGGAGAEEAEGEEAEDDDEEAAHERSAVPQRSMQRALLAGPDEAPDLFDWRRVQAAGWERLHASLRAYVEAEAAELRPVEIDSPAAGSGVAGVVEVTWEGLLSTHRSDRLTVLRDCIEWVNERRLNKG